MIKAPCFRFAAVLAFLLAAGSAAANDITVTSFLDNNVGCTLRKAVANANAGGAANADCGPGSAAGNVVVLGTGTYVLSLPVLQLVNRNITITGNGPAATIVDGQNLTRIFDNFDGTTAITITLQNFHATHGNANITTGDIASAGALYIETDATAIVSNMLFSGHVAQADAGAILNRGNLTINNSTFSSNSAGGSVSGGGAIYNSGKLAITNSTFDGNSAQNGGAIYHAGSGTTLTLVVSNSTFSGNSGAQRGGAIAAGSSGSSGPVTLTHVTITGNTSTGSSGTGGGIYTVQPGAFNIDRSIIAGNTATATSKDCNSPNPSINFNSLNYNVIGTTAGCSIVGTTTNNFVGNALLNALASNGGPTQTVSLQAYSPARDRSPTCATSLDQRGNARPLGIACDSGAYEAAPTVPNAPAIGTATAGNGQVSVAFTAPNNGGAAITGYTVTASPGGIQASGAASPIVVAGLNTATAYTFTVTAVNSVGTSASSAASNSVTPRIAPGAPTIGTATAGNAQASVAFTAPVSNGGSAITGYTVTSTPGGITSGGSVSPITVTGLINGTAYTFKVTAANIAGTGAASAASNSVTPRTVPGAPTIGMATNAGTGKVFVAFTAPASNGGSVITGYTAISSPGGFTATGSASPLLVTGLTNGTPYTFTVTAANVVGTGAPSAASNSATPATTPDAPTIGTATAGNGQASVTYTAPAFNGGSAITSYTAVSSPGGFQATGSANPLVVTGLANGTAYTFTVRANNAIGGGDVSAASNGVTPRTVPGAPAIGTATAGNGQASVAFTAPASNGGSAITSYTATSSPGGITASGTASPLVVTELGNGTAYTFTVTASNVAGNSAPSAASNSVTPSSAPKPFDFNGDGKADLIWSNTANGATYFWYMNGASLIADAFVTTIDPSWVVQGVADFNRDGHPDLVWRNNATGNTYVWYMNGTTLVSDAFLFSLPPEWVIQGVADFNGDGKPDFLMRNSASGNAFVWFFNDAAALSDQFLFGIDPVWKVEGIGDFNGDGKPDLLFRNQVSGLAFAWYSQYSAGALSLGDSSGPIFGIDPAWEIVQVADYNGDGNADLVFRNRNTGLVFVWYLNGVTLGASDFITQIDPSWELVPRR